MHLLYMAINCYSLWLGLAVLMQLKYDSQTYVQSFFTLEFYCKTYKNAILHPLTADDTFPLTELSTIEDSSKKDSESDENYLLPLSTCRPMRRPQKYRIHGAMERDGYDKVPRCQNRYGRCKGLGHSKKTCVETI